MRLPAIHLPAEFIRRLCLTRVRLGGLALALLVLLMGARVVAAQDDGLTLAAYWAHIAEMQARASAEIADLPANPSANPSADPGVTLNEIADELEAITHVTLPDGRLQAVNHQLLVNELRAESTSAEAAADLLAALLAEAPHAVSQTPTYDAQPLDQILANSAFDYGSGEPSWLARQWSALQARLREGLQRLLDLLLPDSLRESGFGRLLANIITVAGAIGLLLVLAYASRDLIRQFVIDAKPIDPDALDDRTISADQALQRADELSHGGDYRTAVRYLYLSTLLLLEERGVLRYNRSLTNREYLRSVSDKPELSAVLQDVVDVFDNVWYGFHTLEEPEYRHYEAQVKQLKGQRP